MKKYILFTFLSIALPLMTYSQNINFSEKDLVGRWIEIERIEGDQITEITTNNDTYIFRENLIFHKGESTEGLILFNIAGKYSVEDTFITIIYKNYTDKVTEKQKPNTLKLEVLSIDKSKNELILNIKDYDYEYQIKLKRQ